MKGDPIDAVMEAARRQWEATGFWPQRVSLSRSFYHDLLDEPYRYCMNVEPMPSGVEYLNGIEFVVDSDQKEPWILIPKPLTRQECLEPSPVRNPYNQ